MGMEEFETIKRELKNNYSSHEVFNYQGTNALEEVVKYVKYNENDILFEININNIMPYYKHRTEFVSESQDEEKYWNHVVSILFFNQLKENYGIDNHSDLDTQKKIMTREEVSEYYKAEPALLNRNDVIEAIRELNNPNARVHIVVRALNNESIWKELTNYLQDGLPFKTMLYSEGEIPKVKVDVEGLDEKIPFEEAYNFILFDKQDEGTKTKKRQVDQKVYRI